MSRKTTKRLLLWGMLGLLIVAAIFGVWATHGFLWSVYTPIYDRLLYGLPSPPGLLPETDEKDLNPESPWGYRTYRVDENHSELVSFLVTELPPANWHPLQHDASNIKRGADTYLQVDRILLVNYQSCWYKRFWLIVVIYTDVNAQGIRVGNSLVTWEVHRNEDIAKSRYSP